MPGVSSLTDELYAYFILKTEHDISFNGEMGWWVKGSLHKYEGLGWKHQNPQKARSSNKHLYSQDSYGEVRGADKETPEAHGPASLIP